MPNSTPSDLETVVFQVTSRCPYHCPQCYMQKGNEDLPLDVVKKYTDLACKHGAKAMQITGGEPLLYPHLTSVIRYAKNHEMYSFLATSGFGHSPEMYSSLQENGLSILCVSINHIDEAKNAETRDGYAVSLAAIRDAHACGIPCMANVVVTDDMFPQLMLLGEYLRSIGVCGVNILRPFSSYDGEYLPQISAKTIESLRAIVSADRSFWRVESCFWEYWEHIYGIGFSCRDLGKHTWFVNVDSSVSPCSKTTRFRYATVEQMQANALMWGRGCRDA